MIQLLFLQGAGAAVHDEWDNKLVASLKQELGPGYSIRYPRKPGEEDPKSATWAPAVAKELATLPEGSVVVAHSVGAAILLHVLSERPLLTPSGGLFLIAAPFMGGDGWPNGEFETPADVGAILPAAVPVFLYHGTADEDVPFTHLALHADAMPQAVVRQVPGGDHQLGNDLAVVAADIRSLAPARS